MKNPISIFIIFFILFLSSLTTSAEEKRGDIVCIASTSNWCNYNEECTGITEEPKTIFDIYLDEKYLHWIEENNDYQTFFFEYSKSKPMGIININIKLEGNSQFILIDEKTGKFARIGGGFYNLQTQHLYGTCRFSD